MKKSFFAFCVTLFFFLAISCKNEKKDGAENVKGQTQETEQGKASNLNQPHPMTFIMGEWYGSNIDYDENPFVKLNINEDGTYTATYWSYDKVIDSFSGVVKPIIESSENKHAIEFNDNLRGVLIYKYSDDNSYIFPIKKNGFDPYASINLKKKLTK